MPTYTYTDTESRYYSTLGISAEPGASAEFADNPPDDGRWALPGSDTPPARPAELNPTEG